jgi:glutathione synthase/RimK-type ligase-like ATP-grasp enzyme
MTTAQTQLRDADESSAANIESMPGPAQGGEAECPETPFLGFAPFLRMNIAGTDLLPVHREMLARVERRPDDTNLWMNLANVLLCLGERDLGLKIQAYALGRKRAYRLAASRQPAKLRLLLLLMPGDLAANTPLDCLLEASDIDLVFYYVSPGAPLAAPVPEHDAVFVAIGESEQTRALLAALEQALAGWPRPVLNAPQHIPATGRARASALLQHAPGLRIPPTLRASRRALRAIARSEARLSALFERCDFPVILRPVGSHAGRSLAKIDCAAQIAGYLSRVDEAEFYLSPFIDYSGTDGLFRKYRIALVGGVAYACHMAVSSNWMIHYVNAGMYEDAHKRAEEADFMARFGDFAARHRPALDAIYRRTMLDYVCVDCAETADGELLVFEIDHAMVVHAMDPEYLFPRKRQQLQKVQTAFRNLLFGSSARRTSDEAQALPQ